MRVFVIITLAIMIRLCLWPFIWFEETGGRAFVCKYPCWRNIADLFNYVVFYGRKWHAEVCGNYGSSGASHISMHEWAPKLASLCAFYVIFGLLLHVKVPGVYLKWLSVSSIASFACSFSVFYTCTVPQKRWSSRRICQACNRATCC